MASQRGQGPAAPAADLALPQPPGSPPGTSASPRPRAPAGTTLSSLPRSFDSAKGERHFAAARVSVPSGINQGGTWISALYHRYFSTSNLYSAWLLKLCYKTWFTFHILQIPHPLSTWWFTINYTSPSSFVLANNAPVSKDGVFSAQSVPNAGAFHRCFSAGIVSSIPELPFRRFPSISCIFLLTCCFFLALSALWNQLH